MTGRAVSAGGWDEVHKILPTEEELKPCKDEQDRSGCHGGHRRLLLLLLLSTPSCCCSCYSQALLLSTMPATRLPLLLLPPRHLIALGVKRCLGSFGENANNLSLTSEPGRHYVVYRSKLISPKKGLAL